MFLDNVDIYIAGSVLAVFLQTKWSTLALNASFISATFAGMLIGTLGAGVLADRYGRKFSFQFNLGLFGLASIACGFCPTMQWLIATRFVCGIGLGAELVIGPSTMAEFVPPSVRGRWVATLSLIASNGLWVSTLLSWWLIPMFTWRIMFILPGIGALILLYLRKAIPESPRWLEVNGRYQECDALISKFEAEGPAHGSLLPLAEPMPVRTAESLFQRKLIRPLILGSTLIVVLFAALYGVITWVPTFLLKQGIPINKTLGQVTLMSLGGPVGAFIANRLLDRLGRRRAIIGASILAAAVTASFGIVTSQLAATIAGFLVVAVVYFLIATIQCVYLPELFPTEIRVRCNAICLGMARISSMFVPFGVVFLYERGGVIAVVGSVGVAFLIEAVMMAAIGIETSRKSLDMISAGLKSSTTATVIAAGGGSKT
jgi:putative MFS transporter